jgi:hypothetical protein
LVLVNVIAFAIFWVIGFVLTHMFEDSPAEGAMLAVAAGAGVLIALWLRAQVAAFVLAAMLAVTLSEFFIRTAWGDAAVFRAPNHFAVLSAGLLGVFFGAMLFRQMQRNASAPAS